MPGHKQKHSLCIRKTRLFKHLQPFHCCNNSDTGALRGERMNSQWKNAHLNWSSSLYSLPLSPPQQDIMECVQKCALWVWSKCSPKPSVHTLPSFNKQMSADSKWVCVCVHLCSRGLEIQMSLLWTIIKDLLHPFKDWLYKVVRHILRCVLNRYGHTLEIQNNINKNLISYHWYEIVKNNQRHFLTCLSWKSPDEVLLNEFLILCNLTLQKTPSTCKVASLQRSFTLLTQSVLLYPCPQVPLVCIAPVCASCI